MCARAHDVFVDELKNSGFTLCDVEELRSWLNGYHADRRMIVSVNHDFLTEAVGHELTAAQIAMVAEVLVQRDELIRPLSPRPLGG